MSKSVELATLIRARAIENLCCVAAVNRVGSDGNDFHYSGDSVDIGFNVTYLLDVLNNLKCDQVSISLGDANSSALITVPDDPNFKYVVMPMRI